MRKNKYSVVVVLSLIIKDHCVDACLRIEGEDAVSGYVYCSLWIRGNDLISPSIFGSLALTECGEILKKLKTVVFIVNVTFSFLWKMVGSVCQYMRYLNISPIMIMMDIYIYMVGI